MDVSTSTIQLSSWAKFCIEVCGLRHYHNGKLINKHKLFSIIEGKFDLNNYSPSVDGGRIAEYLASRFEVRTIDLRGKFEQI